MKSFFKFWENNFSSEKYSTGDEYLNDWADSITIGWEYTCYLSFITPRICLENDGIILTDISKKPALIGECNKHGVDGDPSGLFGYWSRRHGFEERFETLANISENKSFARSSDIGRIPFKSRLETNYRNFLIDFRTIVEQSCNVEIKIFKINNVLRINSNENLEIFNKLKSKLDFPVAFFKNEICSLNGVNSKISDLFWNAGYFSSDEILNAPDKELIKIQGITNKLLEKIRKK